MKHFSFHEHNLTPSKRLLVVNIVEIEYLNLMRRKLEKKEQNTTIKKAINI